jgi:putative transposase
MNWKQLLASITGSVDEELRLRNAYLEAENRIMRHQIKARRVQLTDAERKTLTEMGHKLGRQALKEIATVAKPDTILAWHRTLVVQQSDNFQPRKSLGRPRIDQELEALVVRMARENRSWGYDRIVGAVANLGYHISDQTVGNILKRHGIPPAPERKQTMTWTEFIRIHRDVLMATDFFTTDVWGWLGFVISSLLCCIHVGRRMIHAARMTVRLHACWMLPISPRSPDWHADAERWIRSVTKPGLSRLLLCGPCAWWCGLHGQMTEDHQEHLPRGMGQVVFLPAVNPHPIRDGPLRSRPRHSGRLQEDPCEAA